MTAGGGEVGMENIAATAGWEWEISPLSSFADQLMAPGGGGVFDLRAHFKNDPFGGFLDLLDVQEDISPVPLFDFPGSLLQWPAASSPEASAFQLASTSPSVSSSSVEAADGPARSGVTVEAGAGDEDDEQIDEKPKLSSVKDSVVGEKKKKGQTQFCHPIMNCYFQMERYVFKRRTDGIYIINLGKTWEKLQLAARVIVAIENPQDIIVQSARPYGQRAVLKFALYDRRNMSLERPENSPPQ